MWFFQTALLLLISVCNSKSTKNESLPIAFSNMFLQTADVLARNYPKNDTVFEPALDTDAFIAKYHDDVENVWGRSRSRRRINKRNLETPGDIEGIYKLTSLNEVGHITVNSPIDIVLFKLGKDVSFAAAIESNDETLVLYEFKESNFEEVYKTKLSGAVKLETFVYANKVYLIVARKSDNFEESPTIIYQVLDENPFLRHIQSIVTPNAIDLVVWSNMNQIFLIILEPEEKLVEANGSISINYEIETPIYCWLGRHFDVMDTILTYNPQKIVAFTINELTLVAVANLQDNNKERDVATEVFRYDLEENKFMLHQKIPFSATNVVYFELSGNEIFLIFSGKENSVVYKYLDGYFIPFQNIQLGDSYRFYPIKGFKNEFLLIVIGKREPQFLQYNGWRMIESKINNLPEIFGTGLINNLRHYIFNGEVVIVVVNLLDSGDMVNIVSPIFECQNDVKEIYNEMENWANQMTELISEQNNHIEHLARENGLNMDDFNFEEVDSVIKDPKNDMKLQIKDDDLPDLKTFFEELEIIKQDLKDIEITFDNSLQQNVENIIENLSFDNLEITSATFDNINLNFLNDEDINVFFDNIHHLSQDFEINPVIEFEDVIIDDEITAKIINGHHINEIIHTEGDEAFFTKLEVNGNVELHELQVGNTIHNVKVTKENILLTEGDQSLDELISHNLEIKNLFSAQINELKFENEIKETKNTSLLEKKELFSVMANNLVLNDLINDIDFNFLNNNALRKRGNQDITGTYVFNDLTVKEIITDGFINNHKIPEDLIPIDNSQQYFVNHDLNFEKKLSADRFTITERLNNIDVVDSKLNILFKNLSEKQFVTGKKVFSESVDLFGPLQLQGKIQSEGLEKMNPVSMINDALDDLVGNFTLSGNVVVENLLDCGDLGNDELSVGRLKELGLKLDDEVDVEMHFKQQIYVKTLNTNSINDKNVTDWLVMGTNVTQFITGTKTFPNDILISSSSRIDNINGINLETLHETMLRANDFQTINGTITLENVYATNILSDHTTFQNQTLNDLFSGVPEDVIINEPLNIKDTLYVSKNLNIQGVIQTESSRSADDLVIDHLSDVEILNDLDLSDLFKTLNNWDNDVILENEIHFDDLSVDSIFFTDSFNGFDDFGEWFLDTEQEIPEAWDSLDQVEALNGIFVDNNFDEIFDDVIFVDQDTILRNYNFDDGIVAKEVVVDGNIGDIKLSEHVISGKKLDVIEAEHFNFNNDLIIDGDLHVHDHISNVNLNTIGNFVKQLKNNEYVDVTVTGNVFFAETPTPQYLNDRDLEAIDQQIWYQNGQDVTITGIFDFDELVIDGEILLNGTLNRHNLDSLPNNYFSSSEENQVIWDNIIFFEGGITVNGNLSANASVVDGYLMDDINLDQVLNKALLQDVEQTITGELIFEELIVTDEFVQTFPSVNGFNLHDDVMLYNVPQSVVTGPKIVDNLIVNSTELDVLLHGINITKWVEESVLCDKDSTLNGNVVFGNTTHFKDSVSVNGMVNNFLFDDDHIMLKKSANRQIITGQKKFSVITNRDNDILPENVHFSDLRMKHSLNGFNVTDLLQNQAYNNEDLIINSVKTFTKPLTTTNLQTNKDLFGFNASDLFEIDQYEIQLLENEYETILKQTEQITQSLKSQAFYLDDFEIIEKNSHNVYPVKTSQDLYFIELKSNRVTYRQSEESLDLVGEIGLVKVLDFKNTQVLFVETEVDGEHIARIYGLVEGGSFEVVFEVQTRGTVDVNAFLLPQTEKQCVILLAKEGNYSTIYCGVTFLVPEKQVPTYKPKNVKTLTINDRVYLVIIDSNLSERFVNVWYLDEYSPICKLVQVIHHVAQPNGLAAVTYINKYGNLYLIAIASGHSQYSISQGFIDIQRFNEYSYKFSTIQKLYSTAPILINFATLPTEQLILYTVTNDPTRNFVVYTYENLAGFSQTMVAPVLKNVTDLVPFWETEVDHGFIVNSHCCSQKIQAIFKGTK